jgi:hypothetical protein
MQRENRENLSPCREFVTWRLVPGKNMGEKFSCCLI